MAEVKTFVGKIVVKQQSTTTNKIKSISDRDIIERELNILSKDFNKAYTWGIGDNKIVLKEDNETVEIQLYPCKKFPLSEEKTWEEINLQDIIKVSEMVDHWDQEEWLESHIEIEGGTYEGLILG